MEKIKYLFFLYICLFILTGCWDTVNIEDRGFIIGTAIDVEGDIDVNRPNLIVTNQMVLPAGMSYPAQGGSDQDAFVNFTSESKSIYKIDEEIASRSSKQPFYEHLAILIISEEVASEQELFSNLLDTYIRDIDFRRGIKAVVAKGEAKKLLEFKNPVEKLPTIHIDNILEHGNKKVGAITPKTVGDIEEFQLKGNSFILPHLEFIEFVAQKKGAVFHGRQHKMVGLLDVEEVHALEIIKGKQHVKIIDFAYKEKTFALKVIRLQSKMKVNPKNLDDIKTKIEIELEATIKETFIKDDLTQSSEIDNIQKAVAEEITKSIENLITKAQGEYGTDILNVWEVMETKHYDTWVKVKDDWEEGEYYFKNVSFDIEVIPEIYSIGTTNRTQ